MNRSKLKQFHLDCGWLTLAVHTNEEGCSTSAFAIPYNLVVQVSIVHINMFDLQDIGTGRFPSDYILLPANLRVDPEFTMSLC